MSRHLGLVLLASSIILEVAGVTSVHLMVQAAIKSPDSDRLLKISGFNKEKGEEIPWTMVMMNRETKKGRPRVDKNFTPRRKKRVRVWDENLIRMI